jgi:CHRD domain/PEP-CTERM motif
MIPCHEVVTMRKSAVAALLAVTIAAPAYAGIDVYVATLLGSNECGGTPITCGTFGDPDGYGAATILIDNVTNEVSWAINVNLIDNVVAAHIHFAPAGANGPVRVDFSGQLAGTVTDADAAFITPTSFADKYVNVHTTLFPGGAVRGQLVYVTSVVPEPATSAMLLGGLGAVLAFARRRRRRSASA